MDEVAEPERGLTAAPSRPPPPRRRRAIAAGAVLATLAALQFFRPAPPRAAFPSAAPMSAYVSVPEEVDRLLRRACYDCHSDETRWPWYSRVAPVSWFVARDVQHGRTNLDFSRWSPAPAREPTPRQRIRWICQEIREREMPPTLYRLLHPRARLTEAERDVVCAWTTRALRQIGENSEVDESSNRRDGVDPAV